VFPVRYGLYSYILFRYRPTQCICVFRMVFTVNSDCFPKALTGWALQWRRNVFPVRYELDLYILFGKNSVFKGLNPRSLAHAPCYTLLADGGVHPSQTLATHTSLLSVKPEDKAVYMWPGNVRLKESRMTKFDQFHPAASPSLRWTTIRPRGNFSGLMYITNSRVYLESLLFALRKQTVNIESCEDQEVCRILGSHIGGYEEYYLLGYNVL
jgi:hypothetical protein